MSVHYFSLWTPSLPPVQWITVRSWYKKISVNNCFCKWRQSLTTILTSLRCNKISLWQIKKQAILCSKLSPSMKTMYEFCHVRILTYHANACLSCCDFNFKFMLQSCPEHGFLWFIPKISCQQVSHILEKKLLYPEIPSIWSKLNKILKYPWIAFGSDDQGSTSRYKFGVVIKWVTFITANPIVHYGWSRNMYKSSLIRLTLLISSPNLPFHCQNSLVHQDSTVGII